MASKILNITDNLFSKRLPEGTLFEKSITIEDSQLTVNLGSGKIKLLSTAGLIALAEQCCFESIAAYLLNELVSVSAEFNFKHIHPVKAGDSILVRASLKFIQSNKLFFDIVIEDASGVLIGMGAHERYIVHGLSFIGEKNLNNG